MLKLRKLDILIASAFIAFFLTWHYRADIIDIWRVASTTDALLSSECR